MRRCHVSDAADEWRVYPYRAVQHDHRPWISA